MSLLEISFRKILFRENYWSAMIDDGIIYFDISGFWVSSQIRKPFISLLGWNIWVFWKTNYLFNICRQVRLNDAASWIGNHSAIHGMFENSTNKLLFFFFWHNQNQRISFIIFTSNRKNINWINHFFHNKRKITRFHTLQDRVFESRSLSFSFKRI